MLQAAVQRRYVVDCSAPAYRNRGDTHTHIKMDSRTLCVCVNDIFHLLPSLRERVVLYCVKQLGAGSAAESKNPTTSSTIAWGIVTR